MSEGPKKRWFQFTLRHVLWWVLVACATLAVMRIVDDFGRLILIGAAFLVLLVSIPFYLGLENGEAYGRRIARKVCHIPSPLTRPTA